MKIRITLLGLISALFLCGCQLAEEQYSAGGAEEVPEIVAEERQSAEGAEEVPEIVAEAQQNAGGAEEVLENVYTIDEPYVYPITPAMEEWKSLSGMSGKVKACDVPQELLENMTTKALLQTALDYPLFASMFAFDTLEMGFASLISHCRPLEEFCKRPDAMREVLAYEMDVTRFPYSTNADEAIRLRHTQLEALIEFQPTFEEASK